MKNDDEIVRVLNAADVVMQNPEIYWGKKNPLPVDFSLAMLDQIESESGVRGDIDNFKDWNIVVSEYNWIKPLVEKNEDICNLFSDVRSLSDGRDTSLRTEFFLSVVSQTIAVWYCGRFVYIKGEGDDSVQAYIKEKYLYETCVLYIARK